MTLQDIALDNHRLYGECSEVFFSTFGKPLSRFWSPLFGFEVVKFDDWVKPPSNVSCAKAVEKRWGKDAELLVRRLLRVEP